MTAITGEQAFRLAAMIEQRLAGWGLPRDFYTEPWIYQADLDSVWRQGWLFVGHSCEIPAPGDYLTFWLDTDPLIVIRDDEGTVRALHNICRHRGTTLCEHDSGHVGRIVCPYHQWTYARNGSLISCRGMDESLDRSQLGLITASAAECEGLIFVSLSANPPDFNAFRESCGVLLKPQGFARAKVAKIVDYNVPANWKVVWENNRECYHCNAGHPQYIKANFDHYNRDDTTPAIRARIDAAVARSQAKWEAAGLSVSHTQTGMCAFPAPGQDGWFAANRTALVEGYVSETMTGRQVAPLMGDYREADVGTLRIRTMPNFWNHSSCDHGVSTRLLPAGPFGTRVRVTWLVDRDAQEGRDYQLSDLMPFWQLTSEQDWELCRRVQLGVSSTHYRPGPLSSYKEYNVDAFLGWYLQQLAQHCQSLRS
jgi:Rieske 2Fe-2S family protein